MVRQIGSVKMKWSRYRLSIFLSTVTSLSVAQSVPLDLYTCLDSAGATMPLLKQQPLLAEVLANKLRNYATAYLPGLSANGQASYQSDVPALPFSAPGSPEINIPKDQYKAWVEINQPLYDAGLSGAQRLVETSSNEVALQNLRVVLLEYKRQVVQVYFQVLLATRQQEVVQQSIGLLGEKLKSAQAAYEQGVLQQNDVLRIQAQILSLEKNRDGLLDAAASGMEVLELLTGIPTAGRVLTVPGVATHADIDLSSNPELRLLDVKARNVAAGERLLNVQRMPRLNLFGQVGVGRPNPFNFFREETSLFYIAGLRVNWTIFDWNKTAREKQNLVYNMHMLDLQKNQKSIEVDSRIVRLREERDSYGRLLEKDESIVTMRRQIRENASRQLDEGIITSTDYLEEILAEQQAAVARNIDEINVYKNNVLIQLEEGSDKN